jgi:hypothetical protein
MHQIRWRLFFRTCMSVIDGLSMGGYVVIWKWSLPDFISAVGRPT